MGLYGDCVTEAPIYEKEFVLIASSRPIRLHDRFTNILISSGVRARFCGPPLCGKGVFLKYQFGPLQS